MSHIQLLQPLSAMHTQIAGAPQDLTINAQSPQMLLYVMMLMHLMQHVAALQALNAGHSHPHLLARYVHQYKARHYILM